MDALPTYPYETMSAKEITLRVQKIDTLFKKRKKLCKIIFVFVIIVFLFFSAETIRQEFCNKISQCAVWIICAHTGSLVLHEHAAFGAVLSDGGWVLVNLSPGRLLRNPLKTSAWTGAFERRPMWNVGYRCQGGYVENITHGVFRIPGSALGIGHGADLPRQMSAL